MLEVSIVSDKYYRVIEVTLPCAVTETFRRMSDIERGEMKPQPASTVLEDRNQESQEMDATESCCSALIFIISCFLLVITFPFSLCVCLKMVQVRILDTFSGNLTLLTHKSDCHT